MKVLGIMGSPRKNGNTNALLNQALEGAKSLGAKTSIIYVNELNIRGCQGCNTCKEVQHCILDDDMKQINKKVGLIMTQRQPDAVITAFLCPKTDGDFCPSFTGIGTD